jgi:tetratricopeptide (TPR) repeat protein
MSNDPQPNTDPLPGQPLSLDQMAQIHLQRGELVRARTLFEQSVEQRQQAGDMRGSAAALSNLANVCLDQGEADTAEQLLHQSLFLYQSLRDPQGGAYQIVKLGQLAQLRGEQQTALAHYREGLRLFEDAGAAAEAAQVRQMIGTLVGEQGSGGAGENVVAQVVQRARAAAAQGDTAAAIAAQEQAVGLLRQAGGMEEQSTLVARSVALYRLAGYYSDVHRHDDAVAALEEVVELNRRTGHAELSQLAPRALDGARKMAALSPADQKQLLEQLQRTTAALGRMSAGERATLQAATQRIQLQSLADQTRDAAIKALRGEADRQDIAAQMEHVAEQAAADQEEGSPWLELAAFVRAVAAVLRGETPAAVPATYEVDMAAVLEMFNRQT